MKRTRFADPKWFIKFLIKNDFTQCSNNYFTFQSSTNLSDQQKSSENYTSASEESSPKRSFTLDSSSPSASPRFNNARKRVKTNVPVLTAEQRYAKERDEKKKIKQKLNKNSKTNVIWTLFDEECEKMGIFKSPVQSVLLVLVALALVSILVFLAWDITNRADEKFEADNQS